MRLGSGALWEWFTDVKMQSANASTVVKLGGAFDAAAESTPPAECAVLSGGML